MLKSVSVSSPSWRELAKQRFAAQWRFKFLAITSLVSAFFVAYFVLLRNPIVPVTVMRVTWMDEQIRFWPAAIFPYASLWFYFFIAPSLLLGRHELRAYATSLFLVAGIGLSCFLIWPTVIPRADIDALRYPLFGFLQQADGAGNACPSLHVAFAIFSAVWLERLIRSIAAPRSLSLGNALWCATIIYSTMATKQHVAVDVLAGATLGFFGGLIKPGDPWRPTHSLSLQPNRQWLAVGLSIGTKLVMASLGMYHAHPAVAAVLFFGTDLWLLSGLLIADSRLLMPVVTRFETTRREVWLTIDDGPEPATTLPMLDLLDRYNARATFFVIGTKVAEYPKLAHEILRRGHSLGNHTLSHPLLTFWSSGPKRTAREVDACTQILAGIGLPAPTLFRPPVGIKTAFLRQILARRGQMLVSWTARGREHFSAGIDRPLKRLLRKLRPGSIFLLHESNREGPARVALLAALLERLAAENYSCVLPEPESFR